MSVDQLVNIPLRTQPQATFASNADGLWNQLNVYATQVNAAGADITNRQSDVITRQADVTAKQAAAAASATAAANSATTAQGAVATSGAAAWVSGNTYAVGNLAYSLINFATYRRKTAGAGTIDPSLDKTNWASANAISGGEIGQLVSFSGVISANTITSPNSGVYLKAGVQVSRSAALVANYDVSQLETMGICSPYSGAIPFVANAMTFGAGLFCIVGAAGQIATSPDGVTWTPRTSGTTDNLNVVEYLNGQFVAAGTAWLGSSADGISWVAKTAPANTNLKTSIAYISGRYVVGVNASSTSSMFSSLDLTTWANVDIGNTNVPYSSGWAYLSGKFYWVCNNGLTVSLDLEGTPKIVDSVSTAIGNICVLNGKLFKFPTAGSIGRSSSDGVTWANFTCTSTGPSPNQSSYVAAYGNSVYVATTGAGMQSSSDGITWTARAAAAGIQGVTFLGGMFLTVGSSVLNNIYTSTDGVTWTLRTPTSSMKVYSIAYSGSTFVAAGSNTGGTSLSIASSTDGATWTNRVLTASGTYFSDVVFGNSKFVALPDTVGTIYYSTDGITWNSTTVAAVVSAGVVWNQIRFINGYFIVSTLNNGMLYYSTDGTTWNAATVTTSVYPSSGLGVSVSAYQGGRYWGLSSSSFAVADSINSWYSTALGYYPATTIRLATSGAKLLSIGAANGSSASHLMVSGDGLCWISLKKPTDLTVDSTIPTDFAYANGQFVFTVGNKIVTSPNGLSWNSNAMSANTTAVYGISYGAGVWWFTGNNGYAYTSTDLATFTIRYGAGTTPLTVTPVKSVFGNSLFVGANLATGTSVAITPDGTSGNIGIPVAPTNPVGTSFYVKVK